MKQNILIYTICLLLSVTHFSCSQEDMMSENTQKGQVPLTLQITVTNYPLADDIHTRAVEDEYKTNFSQGDRLGLLIIKEGSPIQHMVYTYTVDGVWDGAVLQHSFGKDVKYIAYYPYNDELVIDSEADFDNYIKNFAPKSDQSLYQNYTASDLMSGEGIIDAVGGKLTVKLYHRMAMALLEMPKATLITPDEKIKYHAEAYGVPKLSWGEEENIAKAYYAGDRYYRFLVNPNSLASVILKGSYAYRGTRHIELELLPNEFISGKYKAYKIDEEITPEVIRKIIVGDYYMNDGTIVPGDMETIPSGCIGVVFQTNPERISEYEKDHGWTNGYVMALTDAHTRSTVWGNEFDENSGGEANEALPFYTNINSAQMMYNNLEGYQETAYIMDTYKDIIANTSNVTYQSFYYVNVFGTSEATSDFQAYAAPEKSSGWYLPSSGQWWDILENLGGMTELEEWRSSGESNVILSNVSETVSERLNSYLSKKGLPNKYVFRAGKYYWSSSEINQKNVCRIRFNDESENYSVSLTTGAKRNAQSTYPRCVLAF